MLDINNISKYFKRGSKVFTALSDVSLKIEEGDYVSVTGTSGSGKSTTLKAILGEFDYEGNILVFGIDAHSTKSIAPFIGYVPQDLSRMYGNFNCLENIVAFGRQFGVPDDILIPCFLFSKKFQIPLSKSRASRQMFAASACDFADTETDTKV